MSYPGFFPSYFAAGKSAPQGSIVAGTDITWDGATERGITLGSSIELNLSAGGIYTIIVTLGVTFSGPPGNMTVAVVDSTNATPAWAFGATLGVYDEDTGTTLSQNIACIVEPPADQFVKLRVTAAASVTEVAPASGGSGIIITRIG